MSTQKSRQYLEVKKTFWRKDKNSIVTCFTLVGNVCKKKKNWRKEKKTRLLLALRFYFLLKMKSDFKNIRLS
jgi:exoribonuclease II